MKKKIKSQSYSVVSVLLSMCMLISCMSIGMVTTDAANVSKNSAKVGAGVDSEQVGANKTIYINTEKWGDNASGVRYYVWAWTSGSGGAWYDFTETDTHYYQISVPESTDSYIFFRASSSMAHGWTENTNYWNKTGDISGESGKNCYTFAGYSYGSWTNYTPASSTPVDLEDYQPVSSSSSYQFYVDTADNLGSSTYYYGGNTNSSYRLLTDGGNNYLIWLSSSDISRACASSPMYYAFTTNKSFTGITTNSAVDADATNQFAITQAGTQSYNFQNANNKVFAKIETDASYRDYIQKIGVLYNTSTNKYTVYYYGADNIIESVKIYAKDGVVRKDSNNTSAGNWFQFGKYANTVLAQASGSSQPLENYNASYNAYAEYGVMKKGGSITLTTTMQSQLADYYIRGYCINGTVYELLEASDQPLNASKVAQATYTFNIPEDFADNYLEITPIYYLRDTTNTVVFYVEDYDAAVQNSGWGNTLFADFFYENGHIEGYPGQPLVFYGGRYSMQVATSTYATDGQTNLGVINGVTLNNGYWDYIHSSVVKEVSDNRQTYDYSNFHKIYVEKSDDDLDAIVFSFKYRTQKDNYGYSVNYPASITQSDYASGTGNGWDVLTDYYGEKVDIFGNVLTEEQLQNDPVYIVSNGYVRTYEGQYSTEWVIYSSSGTKLGVIPSSALLIDNASHWTDSTYSDICNDRTLSGYKTTFDYLNNTARALNRPAYITYERNNYGEYGMNTSGNQAGDKNGGYRLDGRWYYSKKSSLVSANTLIEYSNDYYTSDSPEWIEDSFVDGTAKGSYTGTSAYFINTENNYAGQSYYGKTETGKVLSDSSKFYMFEAATEGQWILEGWYLKSQSGSYLRITDANELVGKSARDANSTFVARFVKQPSGTLKITHKVETNTEHPGTGTAYLSLYIFDTQASAESYFNGGGATPLSVQENITSDIVIPASYLQFAGETTEYVVIKLTTTPGSNSVFEHFTGGNDSVSSTIISNVAGTAVNDGNRSYTTTIQFPMQDILEQNGAFYLPKISSIDYISHLNMFSYSLVYVYDSRLYNTQTYTKSGYFTADMMSKYFEVGTVYDSSANAEIANAVKFRGDSQKEEFLARMGPYEDNYRETITWKYSDASPVYSAEEPYKLTVTVEADQIDPTNGLVNIVFKLPYYFDINADGLTVCKDENHTPYEAGETVARLTESATLSDSKTTPYGKWFTCNAEYKDEDAAVFVTTPDKVYNSETGQNENFMYWSIRNEKDVEYARCYSKKLNYVFYNQNSIVTPVYAFTPTTDEESLVYTQIDFLENSRNQWNNNGGGELASNENQSKYPNWYKYGDRMYSDFVLNYQYNKLLLNSIDKNDIETGVLIERVKLLDKDIDDKYVSDASEYTNSDSAHYISDDGKTDANTYLGTVVNGNTTPVQGKTYVKQKIDNTSLDNKNRIQYYYSFANIFQNSSSHPNEGEATSNRNYLYRAYTYLKYNGELVLSDPVYFTIYDMASIDCAYDATEH